MKFPKSTIDYYDFIPFQNGFVFKFIKKENRFIHTFCEGKLLEKMNLSPELILGKSLDDIIPHPQAEQKSAIYEEAWSGSVTNYEGHINDIYYMATLTPYKKNNRVVEVIGTAIDITKEKQNEERIKKTEKLAMVGELAAGIAHEIRNPLTSLKGFTQMIQKEVQEDHLKQYVEIMLDELDRINSIVNEFMMIAKPHENIKICKHNLSNLLYGVLNLIKPEAMLKGISITAAIDSSIEGECDGNQIKQVLINLLQNAIDASLETKRDIHISLKKVDEHWYTIKIQDGGTGISLERQKKLFEPFYTTKEKGTGLGLMVCKRIIEYHQGHILVESKENLGTKVTLTLPTVKNVPSEYGETN
ncbi:ATP-binding protein [Bacillus sp. 2205SS5-2]|uniref:ATP-binding protein n=1 Tax=Bacillus sp. 2205SS5-2 TaxID=3109031 RepID=UPI003007546D